MENACCKISWYEKNAYFAIFIHTLLLYEIVWKSMISIFFIYENCMISIFCQPGYAQPKILVATSYTFLTDFAQGGFV